MSENPGGAGPSGSEGSAPAQKRLSELGSRVVSGVVLIVFSIAATVAGGVAFVALCILAAGLILAEFTRIVRGRRLPRSSWPAYLALFAALAMLLWAGPAYGLALLGGATLLLALSGLSAGREIWEAAGLAYAALPAFALIVLRGDTAMGLHAILFLFACVWGADTFAYFAGRAIGGPKLAPTISPNKTWAGLLGGLAGGVAIASIVLLAAGYPVTPGLAMLAFVLALVSAGGDLFESWLKRRFGVKDSGGLIPGHGGVMDRLDGLVFSALAMWAAAILVAGQAALRPGGAADALFQALI